jgi:hypothetical protein
MLSHGDNNVFTQIGLIVLVGLACKNAILIVEFAREREMHGDSLMEAILAACRLRLRPILMTSLAFIMGVAPLVISTRRRLGNAPRHGRGGVLRHGRRHPVRPGLHPRLLLDDPQADRRPRQPPQEAGAAGRRRHRPDPTVSRAMTLPRLLLAAASALTLSACAVGPTYHAPIEAPVTLAAADPAVSNQVAPATWWKAFGDPELDSLVDRALASNLDVRIAVARVKQARALFRDSELDRLPRVTTSAGYTRAKQQVVGAGPDRVTLEQADVGFDAAWEIDLFGRVGHQVASARAEADAAQADLRDAQVTITAEVARAYFQLRGAQARRAVAEENAHTQADTVRLTKVRYDIGPGDPVDVESASARLNATEAVIPALRAAEDQAAYRLAVLLGQRPGVLDAELQAKTAATAPQGPTALPIGEASTFCAAVRTCRPPSGGWRRRRRAPAWRPPTSSRASASPASSASCPATSPACSTAAARPGRSARRSAGPASTLAAPTRGCGRSRRAATRAWRSTTRPFCAPWRTCRTP